MAKMDVYELLHRDHEIVSEIFEKLEEADSLRKRENLFHQLKEELEQHTQAEEQFFYSRIESEPKARELTLEAKQEHQVIMKLLHELDELSLEAEEWLPKLKVLRENVEHHVQEEEGQLFPAAQAIIRPQEAEEIEEKIEQMKDQIYQI